MNYGRASEALRVYRLAMQTFIADTLDDEKGGDGEWFGNLALARLPRYLAEDLERHIASARAEREADTSNNEEIEAKHLLEERHYPHIIRENWDRFRQSLKDRDEVLNRMRKLKRFRDKKVAHNSRQLSDEEAIEVISTCRSVVERFDASSTAQLTELLEPPESLHSSQEEVPQEDIWTAAEKIEQDRRAAERRLEKLIDHFLWAGEAMDQAVVLERTLNTLGTDIEVDADEIFSELHWMRFGEILKELIAEAMPFAELDMTEAGAHSGRVHYSLEGSKVESLVIEFDLKE